MTITSSSREELGKMEEALRGKRRGEEGTETSGEGETGRGE